ncbi:hypothetical protein OUZ56_010491 [Daphnia magna]|uniref:C1q domain-containing protein n=1 Tax=Daphnia magna TaxID=35525 RepID=A0ABR0AIP0_9CRUS|nr:hypothetical protein OUZ56_010491 [Daphnia magna]
MKPRISSKWRDAVDVSLCRACSQSEGALGITNNPTTIAILPESSDSGNVSEDEIRVFTKIANKIIQKKLETIEEKIDKVVEQINGEEQRYSKKLTNVAFFAQRNSSFDQKNTIQPYLINRLNDGKAFNQASGIFTVPINGNYHFYFTDLCNSRMSSDITKQALKASAEISGTSIITVRLWANRNQKEKTAQMLAEGHVNSNDMHGWFPVILQATVKLQENDTVEVELLVGSIHESENLEHLITSFGGFLVSPEIV